MVEALAAPAAPAAVAAGQQPQADPGLLPRPRHRRRRPRSCGSIDKLDKLPADDVARSCSSTRPGSPPSRPQQCLDLADDPRRRRRRSSSGCAPSACSDELLDEGLAELAGRRRGLRRRRSATGVTVVADLRIARGLDYYTGTVFEICMAGYEHLSSIGWRRPLRRPRQRRPHDVPRRRHLVRRLAHCSCRCWPTGCSRRAGRCPSAVLVALADEESRAASDAVADALRARGIPCEVAASAAEVRQADPLRRAARHPVRLVHRRRRRPRGQGHPLRRPGARRPRHLDPARRGPDARPSCRPPRRRSSDPHP